MASAVFCAIAWISFSPASFSQQGLPPKAQADILTGEIKRAYTAEDWPKLISLIAEYKKLNGVKLPTPMLHAEAVAASAVGKHEQAFRAVHQYLKRAKDGDPQYASAVAMYPELREAAAKSTSGYTELLLKVAGRWKGLVECGHDRDGRWTSYEFVFTFVADDPLDIESDALLSVYGKFKPGGYDRFIDTSGNWDDKRFRFARPQDGRSGVSLIEKSTGGLMSAWMPNQNELVLQFGNWGNVGGTLGCGVRSVSEARMQRVD